ncbi:MAG TPA: PEP-CTERM sorting domain-containing protein [Tepidisphaeraceae bacterium]|nr:PEP-CTERM sorting domain-containing protein [Tepidisphaeraceae bacterium]
MTGIRATRGEQVRRRSTWAIPTALIALAGSAGAATVPFNENFDAATPGTTLPSPFVETNGAGNANYSVVAGPTAGQEMQALMSATTAASGTTGVPSNASAAVPFPGLPGTDFTVSTDFRIESFQSGGSGSTVNFGLAALGSVQNFSAGTNYRLLYTTTATGGVGKLTLSEFGGGTGLTGTLTSTGTLTPANGLAGTFTLTGTYVGGSLTLTGTLSSPSLTNPLTVTGTDTSVLAGDYFGVRTALNAQLGSSQAGPLTTSQDIRYDNFAVGAVPEPGTLAVLGLGATALLARRRRR